MEKKDLAKRTHESVQSIMASVADGIHPSVSPSTLPKENAIRRIVRRSRLDTTAPSCPANLRELAIPHIYSTTLNDEDFLLFDSGPSDDRIVLFSTNHNLQLLQNSPHWYADGSFRVVPPLFQQLYTIHAVCFGDVIPTVFLLLPDRRRATYERAFNALRSLRPNLNPKSILTNFESEEIGALDSCFEDAVHRGCRFHFGQSVWQRIQRDHRDIMQRCKDDPKFASHVHQLLCLCFVPPDQIVVKFEELCNTEAFRNADSVLRPLLDHFEEVYIGRPTGEGRRVPTFKSDLWNCYEAIVAAKESLEINDSIEYWHRRFLVLMSRCVDCPRPSIWKFIVKLKEEQAKNDQLVLQNLAGVRPNPSSVQLNAAKRAATIGAIVEDFTNLSLVEYLTSLTSYVDFYV